MMEGKVKAIMEDGIMHLAFAVLLCLRQAERGLYFMIEHPVQATSWELSVMKLLYNVKDAVKVNFDFCMMGMKSQDESGKHPVKKRTSIMTNSPGLASGLADKQCDFSHKHVELLNGRARACQE